MFGISLVGASAPDGEIGFTDLSRIAQAMQDLALKVGRSLGDQDGPGRTRKAVEELSQLRLRSISAGSTHLSFAQGPSDALDIDHSEMTSLAERFSEVIDAIGQNTRPDWVSDAVADSAASVVDALQAAAPTVEFSRSDRAPVRIDTQSVRRDVWTTNRRIAGGERVVAGYLEKVDLHSAGFRVRDAMGNAIELESVHEAAEAASLIGAHVRAHGREILNRAGLLTGLAETTIESDEAVPQFQLASRTSVAALLASAPGPSPDGMVELTDDEFDAFIEAVTHD